MSLEFVAPTKVCVVVAGVKTQLELSHVPVGEQLAEAVASCSHSLDATTNPIHYIDPSVDVLC